MDDLVIPLGAERIVLKWISSGSFRMGSRHVYDDEEPVHRVYLEGFWMGETPVTQAQFACWKPDHQNFAKGKPQHPAENLNWDEANGFCSWLREKGFGAQLPTEAQWEYACRAGTTTEYWSGDGEAALAEVGWYAQNSGYETHAVKEKPANPWGLFDMHGNVMEWCADAWDQHAYLRGSRTSQEVSEQTSPPRVIRGGSSGLGAVYCRSASRYWGSPGNRYWYRGFRGCVVGGPARS
jgi:formylglycine-generating enzyme required for sulfatase activity